MVKKFGSKQKVQQEMQVNPTDLKNFICVK